VKGTPNTPKPNFVRGACCMSSEKISHFLFHIFYFLLSCFSSLSCFCYHVFVTMDVTTLKRVTACSQRGCKLYQELHSRLSHNAPNNKDPAVQDGCFEFSRARLTTSSLAIPPT